MSAVTTGHIANSLKKFLKDVVTDEGRKPEEQPHKEVFNIESMSDNWVEDVIYGGPGLLAEKAEGADIQPGTIAQGDRKRYTAKTYALKLMITEETLEDKKYDKVIMAAERLALSTWLTVEYSAANVFKRMANSAYTGPDGLSLVNSAHTLIHGGTASNTMATPLAPSVMAVSVARTAVKKFPGHHGLKDGRHSLKKITCPEDQRDAWLVVLGSGYHPGAGEYNAINVVNKKYGGLQKEPVANVYWDNTTTNYAFITNAEYGLRWLWRVRPEDRSWMENNNTVMYYAARARWTHGWTDWRGIFGVEA